MFEASKDFTKKITSIMLAITVASGLSVTATNYFNAKEIEQKNLEIEALKQEIEKTSLEVNERNKENNIKARELEVLNQDNNKLKEELKRAREEISRGSRTMDFTITAYNVSPEQCGKYEGEEGYGLTATGFDLSGHTVWSARVIAVDPNVIPLGSKVQISFNDPYMKKYDGIYTAMDTGSSIKGNKIDLFLGDSQNESIKFGVQQAKVRLL